MTMRIQRLLYGVCCALVALGATAAPAYSATHSGADFNKDNRVDELDLAKWVDDYGHGPGSDADGNLVSNGNDFLQWQRQLGSTSAPEADISHNPEPTTVVVWGLLAAAVGLRVISRRRRAD
jgi:hypothetical protein